MSDAFMIAFALRSRLAKEADAALHLPHGWLSNTLLKLVSLKPFSRVLLAWPRSAHSFDRLSRGLVHA